MYVSKHTQTHTHTINVKGRFFESLKIRRFAYERKQALQSFRIWLNLLDMMTPRFISFSKNDII